MKVNLKRTDKNLPLPEYQTGGSVGFDIYARQETTIPPKQISYIPTNLIIETPPGYMLMIAARSSSHKKGLLLANGIGIIDQDFCGPNDEIKIIFYNFSKQTALIEKGERIAQAVFVKIGKAEQWLEQTNITSANRGGIGSTGK